MNSFLQGQIIKSPLKFCPAAAANFCFLFLDHENVSWKLQNLYVRLVMAQHRNTGLFHFQAGVRRQGPGAEMGHHRARNLPEGPDLEPLHESLERVRGLNDL